jgi:hypothetical protein
MQGRTEAHLLEATLHLQGQNIRIVRDQTHLVLSELNPVEQNGPVKLFFKQVYADGELLRHEVDMEVALNAVLLSGLHLTCNQVHQRQLWTHEVDDIIGNGLQTLCIDEVTKGLIPQLAEVFHVVVFQEPRTLHNHLVKQTSQLNVRNKTLRSGDAFEQFEQLGFGIFAKRAERQHVVDGVLQRLA